MPAASSRSKITLPDRRQQRLPACSPRTPAAFAPSPNVVRVVDLAQRAGSRAERRRRHRPRPPAPRRWPCNGIIEKPGDVDFFKFTAKKGQQLDVRVYARKPLRSPLDSVLVIHNAQGRRHRQQRRQRRPRQLPPLRPCRPMASTCVSVRDHLEAGGPDYVYRVELTAVKPALTMAPARAAAVRSRRR